MSGLSRCAFAAGCVAAGLALGLCLSGSRMQGQNPTLAPNFPRELVSYREVVRRVLPAVVSINAKGRGKSGQRDDADLGFGSGMIVDRGAVVLTNYHVVEGAEWVEVRMTDGRKFTSRDIRTDKLTDLAIVRLQSKEELPFLEFGDSAAMEMGDRVLAFGAPFGLTGSVTAGIVSAKGRNIHINKYEDFLQTDAAINPGNSGGPLVNLEGRVVGVTSAIKSRNGASQGVALAIASNMAKSIVVQLLRDGFVRRGYIGLKFDELSTANQVKLGLQGGVVVTNVFAKTPAAKAGLKVGDVLVSMAGRPIKDGTELEKTVAGLPLNEPAEVVLLRDGKLHKIAITVVLQPDDFGG
jgi:serine protease Do